jgi:chromosomal replication initiator protein
LVQGKGNRMAYAGAQTIAENPGSSMYNPYFIYGSTGLGKTHLIQAIGNRIYQQHPRAKIRYIHAETYVRDIMKAFRSSSFDEFKRHYHSLDLLLIDDVQFISGKDRTMEEFFYLFNHLLDEKKQVVMTCDTLPANIKNMDDRLKSRFSWGLTVELEPPELEMRVAILQKKAEAAHVQLQEKAAFFIAQHIRSNVRELEGAFKRVAAHSLFQHKPIDIELATEALQDILVEAQRQITVEHIMKTVADFYQLKIADLIGKKRTRTIARPRQMAMALAKDLTQQSLPSIGQVFGGRDHTTVMHAHKTIHDLKQTDAKLAQDYDYLSAMLQK